MDHLSRLRCSILSPSPTELLQVPPGPPAASHPVVLHTAFSSQGFLPTPAVALGPQFTHHLLNDVVP